MPLQPRRGCLIPLESPHEDRLTAEDRRGPTPLFWAHVTPYGSFASSAVLLDADDSRLGDRFLPDELGYRGTIGGRAVPCPYCGSLAARQRAPPTRSAPVAAGRTSHNPPVVGSSPTRPT